jgi:signal transduction histidine kinase
MRAYIWEMLSCIDAMTGFSRTMLAEVLSTKAALICDDAGTDVRFQRSSSMYSAGIRSVMCMPIVAEGEVLGVLEIECLEAARAFDEEDLEIFSVIAAQAGLALRGMTLLAERREQEARAAHAERLALVGRLTGGIAHDFNNLMSIVMSYGELIQGDAPADLQEDAKVIVETARRAASLTRQLRSFSRRDHQRPQSVRLGEVVSGLAPLLQRTLGDPIDVDVATTGTGLLSEDPGRLEQVLMNLAVNARDAMPRGGKLSIRARDLEIAEEETRQGQVLSPGRYVELSVADTGTGISRA